MSSKLTFHGRTSVHRPHPDLRIAIMQGQIMLSLDMSTNAYLLLTGTQRLPFSGDQLGPLGVADALKVWACLTFGEEHVPGRGWALRLAIVLNGSGVRRCPFDLVCELPPEQLARVVCQTNLFGCVRLYPGIVLSRAGLVPLGGQLVPFLSGMSVRSFDGVRTQRVPHAQQV